jgi:hypothetical protein
MTSMKTVAGEVCLLPQLGYLEEDELRAIRPGDNPG